MHSLFKKLQNGMIRVKENSQGFVMITAFMFASISMALAFGMFARGTAFIAATERNQNRVMAFNMAEAGMSAAINQLSSDSTYTGTSYTSLGTSSTTGGYSVSVTTPNDNSQVRIITVSGYSPDNYSTSRGYESKSVTAYVQVPSSQNNFDYAVFATNGLTFSGNATIDSYNSSVAAYSDATATSDGDIATNSTSSGIISVSGNSTIKGDAMIGPSGNTATGITTTSNGVITGTKSAAIASRIYTVATTATASSGALSLSGNTTLTLGAGTYHYSSISITGNASISVTGAVSIYVDGDTSIAGNGISNTTSLPSKCLLFSSGTSVSLSGNGNFYGGIYAPSATITNSGNGVVYGALVADAYNQTGNGNVHFDKALTTSGGSSNTAMDVLAWKENNTVQW